MKESIIKFNQSNTHNKEDGNFIKISKKILIHTFGCQMNEYDSEKMINILAQKYNLLEIKDPNDADIIIFNTCSIREKAQEKVFSDLGRLKKIKQKNPKLIICVGGCVASQEGDLILERAPFVDVIFGPQTIHRIYDLIQSYERIKQPQIDITFPEIEKFDSLPFPNQSKSSSFISIMEGCNKYCSYCVVPYTRGSEISRPVKDILTEIKRLSDIGVKDITLLGQNVNAYKIYSNYKNETIDFSDLLELIHEVDGIERIRFMTSHPKEMTNRMIDIYKNLYKLVSFLHLPVQSGSDRILSKMKRGYTVSEFIYVVNKLREARPSLALSSDFIVGFPGETEEDFNETLNLIEKVNFSSGFSFIYSSRPNTPASYLSDNLTLREKQLRLYKLQNLINKQSFMFSRSLLGTTQRVLAENISTRNPNQLVGRTEYNKVVNFIGSKSQIGKMVNVKITSINTNTLNAELIN